MNVTYRDSKPASVTVMHKSGGFENSSLATPLQPVSLCSCLYSSIDAKPDSDTPLIYNFVKAFPIMSDAEATVH